MICMYDIQYMTQMTLPIVSNQNKKFNIFVLNSIIGCFEAKEFEFIGSIFR
jgi:hypothetical protein